MMTTRAAYALHPPLEGEWSTASTRRLRRRVGVGINRKAKFTGAPSLRCGYGASTLPLQGRYARGFAAAPYNLRGVRARQQHRQSR